MHDLNALKLPMKEVTLFQSAILSIVLAFALISGGIASAVNAVDIQEEYIDPLGDICSQDDLSDGFEEMCNKLQAIRNAQISSAVSSII